MNYFLHGFGVFLGVLAGTVVTIPYAVVLRQARTDSAELRT